MTVKWSFSDPAIPATYTFEINPDADGAPQYEKQITYSATTAPGGKTLIMEGQDKPLQLTWTGTLLSQAQYDAYVTWFNLRRQILLTDDLGRQFWIYIHTFQPKRVRSSNFWKHSYSVGATVLSWV